MADKLPQTVVVLPTFVDGEIPPARKLSVISAQMRAANKKIERAIGDHLDQSTPYTDVLGDSLLSLPPSQPGSATKVTGEPDSVSLDIASLARLVGPASALNPHAISDGEVTVTEVFDVDDIDEYTRSITLSHRPTQTAVTSLTESTAGIFVTPRVNIQSVVAHGDYYFDRDHGQIVFYTQFGDHNDDGSIDAAYTLTVEYPTNPSLNFGGQSSFNTIPDITQLEAAGAALSSTTGAGAGYQRFNLPVCTHHFEESYHNSSTFGVFYPGIDDATSVLTARSPNYNKQLKLPAVITSQLSVGDAIPEGFVVLKNYTTGHAYTNADFLYVSETAIDIGGVDLSGEISAGDKLYLVTVGSDITGAIESLRRSSRHAGDRRFGNLPVRTDDITGLWENSNGYLKSTKSGNHSPQYLHRDGLDSSDSHIGQNAMTGDFALGVAGAELPSAYATGADSVAIVYGHDTNSKSFWDESADAVVHTGNQYHDAAVASSSRSSRTIWVPAVAFSWKLAGSITAATGDAAQLIDVSQASGPGGGGTNVHGVYVDGAGSSQTVYTGHLNLREYVVQAIGMNHTSTTTGDDRGPVIRGVEVYYYAQNNTQAGSIQAEVEIHELDSVDALVGTTNSYTGRTNIWNTGAIALNSLAGAGWYKIDDLSLMAGSASEITSSINPVVSVTLRDDGTSGLHASPVFYGIKFVVSEQNVIRATS